MSCNGLTLNSKSCSVNPRSKQQLQFPPSGKTGRLNDQNSRSAMTSFDVEDFYDEFEMWQQPVWLWEVRSSEF